MRLTCIATRINMNPNFYNVQREYPIQPIPAVGGVVFRGGRVLLIRRKNPPDEGTWAIPGGRIRIGETLQEAAEREVFEETGVITKATGPVFTFDVIQRDESGNIRYHYVIIDLAAEYVAGEINPGDDANDARWVSRNELERLPIGRSTRLLLDKLNFGRSAGPIEDMDFSKPAF